MTLRVRVPVKWLLMRLCWCSVISYSRTTKAKIQFTVKVEHVNSRRGSVVSSLICRTENIFPRHNWTSLDFSEFIEFSGPEWYMNQGYFKDPFSVCDLVVELWDIVTPEVIRLNPFDSYWTFLSQNSVNSAKAIFWKIPLFITIPC